MDVCVDSQYYNNPKAKVRATNVYKMLCTSNAIKTAYMEKKEEIND